MYVPVEEYFSEAVGIGKCPLYGFNRSVEINGGENGRDC